LSITVNLASLKPHHPAAVIAFGSMLGVVAVTVSHTTDAWGTTEQGVPMSQVATETAAQLVTLSAATVAPEAPALPAATVAKDSAPELITALTTRLQWVGSLDAATTTWTPSVSAAVKNFQEKQGLKRSGAANTATVTQLTKAAGDGSIDPRCLQPGIRLCLDKSQKVTRYVKDGVVIRVMDTNIGPEKGDEKFKQYSSTREGVSKIGDKQVNTVSNLYGYSMPYWMQFDGGIGFHFSKYFSQDGYQDTSMGCTTLRSKADAKWLYKNSPKGTKVVVYS
jgi:peptidoglycan hydrolase-like protein with peptidoglycan-binding domain